MQFVPQNPKKSVTVSYILYINIINQFGTDH